ncbi:MAG: HPr(Ser) kinase/phosphatase [Spirochaetes bacterium]|nr:HPr(Ser) kinase/phosphatase [Spirochaetota bacterium]
MKSVKIRELLKDADRLKLRLINEDADLDRELREIDVNRPGLALNGFFEHFAHDRMQVFGQGEHAFVSSVAPENLRESLERYFNYPITGIVFTHENFPPEQFLEHAKINRIPVFVSSLSTSKFIILFTDFLDAALAPQTLLHGTLVEVLGVGILIQGKSGVGKSETALELVQRGHRLVADDAVRIVCRDGTRLYGFVSQTIEHHLEIRGLGIINISDLFGAGAVRASKRIDLIVHLEDWDEKKEYDRLGLEDHTEEILGVEIAVMTIPVRPGRNVPVLLETAAKNFNLKSRGHNAAKKFQERLARMIKEAVES